MNKSNHPSINNYLTNASLFRSNQKNRFVSSYISHKNYFEKDQQANHAGHVPNVTKSKRQYSFLQNKSAQNNPIQENKTDALQATVKKDAKSEDPLSNMSAKLLEQLVKQNGESSIQQESKAMIVESQHRKEKQGSIPSNNSKGSLIKSLNQSMPPINEKLSTKIVVNLTKPPSQKHSQKEKNAKVQENVIESIEQKNMKHSSYLNIRQQEMMYTKNKPQKQQNLKKDDINPYLPSSIKKQKQELNIYQTDNGQVTLKKIQSNSFNPASSILASSPRQALYLTHSSIDRKKESQAEHHERDYFQNIKKDISGYLLSIKQKLNGSYLCLETIEYQFDVLIDKTLQLECEKLKSVLYRLIDEQINDFKQFQRRQFSKNKFYFMSDLFQIKCNIDLRLEQIQQYQLQLKDQYKWKNSINNILGVDYNENINFILKKSDEIQKDMLADITINLNDYVKVVNEEVTKNMKKEIKDNFAKIYERFHEVKSKKKLFLLSNHDKIQNNLDT